MNLQFSLWGTLIKLACTEDEHRYGKLLEGTFAFNYRGSGVKGQGDPQGDRGSSKKDSGRLGCVVWATLQSPGRGSSVFMSFPVAIEHLLYTRSQAGCPRYSEAPLGEQQLRKILNHLQVIV